MPCRDRSSRQVRARRACTATMCRLHRTPIAWRLLAPLLHVLLSLQLAMGAVEPAVATRGLGAPARDPTFGSSAVPPSSPARRRPQVLGAWNATCATALDAACASQRGDVFTCAKCAGAHQADLRMHAHGCDNDMIARWCAGVRMWHYEDPNAGCQTGEEALRIQGVAGAYCAPKCAFLTHKCPPDVPPGVTARPTCAIEDMAAHFCALLCNSSGAASQCGRGASCKPAPNISGICTYDATRAA